MRKRYGRLKSSSFDASNLTMKLNAESVESGGSLLDELEKRHDDVIQQIDELANRIEVTLAQFKPPQTTAQTVTAK